MSWASEIRKIYGEYLRKRDTVVSNALSSCGDSAECMFKAMAMVAKAEDELRREYLDRMRELVVRMCNGRDRITIYVTTRDGMAPKTLSCDDVDRVAKTLWLYDVVDVA